MRLFKSKPNLSQYMRFLRIRLFSTKSFKANPQSRTELTFASVRIGAGIGDCRMTGIMCGNLSRDFQLAHTHKIKSRAQISNSWCRRKGACAGARELPLFWDWRSRSIMHCWRDYNSSPAGLAGEGHDFYLIDLAVAKKIQFPLKHRREWADW